MNAMSASRSNALTGKLTDLVPIACCSCCQVCAESSAGGAILPPNMHPSICTILSYLPSSTLTWFITAESWLLYTHYDIALLVGINDSVAVASDFQVGQFVVYGCLWARLIQVQLDLLGECLVCSCCCVPAVLHTLLRWHLSLNSTLNSWSEGQVLCSLLLPAHCNHCQQQNCELNSYTSSYCRTLLKIRCLHFPQG